MHSSLSEYSVCVGIVITIVISLEAEKGQSCTVMFSVCAEPGKTQGQERVGSQTPNLYNRLG